MINSRLSWEVDVPMSAGQVLKVTRYDASMGVNTATAGMIDSIRSTYDLPPAAVEGMWATAVNIRPVITSNPKEVKAPDVIEIDKIKPDPDVIKKLVSLRLVDEATSEPTAPGKVDIKLVTGAIGEEYAIVRQAARTYMDAVQDNPALLATRSAERAAELSDSSEVAKQTAIQLAFGRRLLKYGLLPDESIPVEMRTTGFDSWIDDMGQTMHPPRAFTEHETDFLRQNYKDSGQAAKNLRRGIWPTASQVTLGVSMQEDPVFYINYQNVASQMPGAYRIPFDPKGTVEMPKPEAAELLTAIFSPHKFPLRLIEGGASAE